MREISKDTVSLTIKSNIPIPDQEPKTVKVIAYSSNFKSEGDLYSKRLLFVYLNCNYNCNFPQCEVNV